MTKKNIPPSINREAYALHLQIKKGQVANRILMVGDPERAKILLPFFDEQKKVQMYISNRGFTTYTGEKRGVPISIMSIGMGMPMMDFAVRETRAITKGPLFIIRLGTCGTPQKEIPLGAIVVAQQSYAVFTHRSYTDQKEKNSSFLLTTPLHPDPFLHKHLLTTLQSSTNLSIVEGSDATTDFFYSTQGRIDAHFPDENQTILSTMLQTYPQTASIQMETYHLFYLSALANRSCKKCPIRVASCAIVGAQRIEHATLSIKNKRSIEKKAGKACLEALTRF